MKYITSCPNCETQFLIDDELIEAFKGDVQCGNCEHVFNTQDRLTSVPDDITNAEEYQASLESEANQDAKNDAIDQYINSTDKSPGTADDFDTHFSKAKKPIKHPILLSFFALLLILGAALQTIYHMRVKIAAEYPQFKPLLRQACLQLNCTVGLPKELDSITIGDSDMQENDLYQSVIDFSSSITNTAHYPQAYPSVVLTLTDEDGIVVIRKLIKPEDYLQADKKVEDGIPARGQSSIKLPLYVHETSVAGYRMLLTYP